MHCRECRESMEWIILTFRSIFNILTFRGMFKKIPGYFWKDSGKLIQQGKNGHGAAFFWRLSSNVHQIGWRFHQNSLDDSAFKLWRTFCDFSKWLLMMLLESRNLGFLRPFWKNDLCWSENLFQSFHGRGPHFASKGSLFV